MRFCRSTRALTTTTLATEPSPLRQEQNFLANDWKKKRRLKGAFLTVLRYRWERGVSRLFPRLLFPLNYQLKQKIIILQRLNWRQLFNTIKNTISRMDVYSQSCFRNSTSCSLTTTGFARARSRIEGPSAGSGGVPSFPDTMPQNKLP